MNQRNLFTAFSIILLLWAVSFYLQAENVIKGSYGEVSAEAIAVGTINIQLASVFLFIISLFLFATRNVPQVLGYFTVGATVLVLMTCKHMFIDGIGVPVIALISQSIIAILTAYLWYKDKFSAKTNNFGTA